MRRYRSPTPKPEFPISSCLNPNSSPYSTRAIVVSLTNAVNHPIKLTKPSGDFAPWNTCQRRKALFVFDWEAAVADAPPLYDAFHFQAIQAALSDTNYRPDHRFLHSLLGLIWAAGEQHLGVLYLTYLVDISLYYAEARVRAPEVGEESVWHWFGNQIDRSLDDANRMA